MVTCHDIHLKKTYLNYTISLILIGFVLKLQKRVNKPIFIRFSVNYMYQVANFNSTKWENVPDKKENWRKMVAQC